MPRTPIERVERLLDKSGGPDACWPFMGGCNQGGYGVIRTYEKKNVMAHRVALMEVCPPKSEKPLALHSCDNPPCCNPAHLRWGTDADNARDKSERGRSMAGRNLRSHCPAGHEYTERNSYKKPNGRGRECRTCINQRNRERRVRLRQEPA